MGKLMDQSLNGNQAEIITLNLKNKRQEQISFVAPNILHVVWGKPQDFNDLPNIMVDEAVNTGGDPTVATGKIDQSKVVPFINKIPKIKFKVIKTRFGYLIQTPKLTLKVKSETGTIAVYSNDLTKPTMIQKAPFLKQNQIQTKLQVLTANAEYYGGGMQNGRYNHTGKILKIENMNDWLDGGISSPAPFVWSTAGFGILNNTYTKGFYDLEDPQLISFSYQDQKADNYYLFGQNLPEILQGYYQLTGKPFILPKFAFYPAHLNAYNRDTWVEVTPASSGARLFEDGKYYREYQPVKPKSFNDKVKKTIKINGQTFVPAVKTKGRVTFVKDAQGNLITKPESLNGELQNYQFSARQIIERYRKNDFPLGWFLPNDGYGAGYGQTSSLAKNIANLKEFANFAQDHGIKTGLWTQENLYPKDRAHPKASERDFAQEVKEAQVAVIKTDVAWVGSGYQAGIGAITDAACVMKKNGNNERPFALTVDGWAGTQKYGAVWTGDQKGGTWQNIAFQIPTYLSSALSGLANVGADIDGIYAGGDPIIQTRDLQWKSFTPLQLFMDGWGSENKTPFTFGGIYAAINRFYLKLKSQLLPYFYTAAYRNRQFGIPLLQPAAYHFADQSNLTADLNHEFLLGNDILVAPIYQNTKMDQKGNDIRNGIYLPDSQVTWIDFFSGISYAGGQVLNKFKTPLWKTPLFIKQGAIIPENNPNNNPSEIDATKQILTFYPKKDLAQTTIYDDDGVSDNYLEEAKFTTTVIKQWQDEKEIVIQIAPTTGDFAGFNPHKQSILKVKNISQPRKILVNGQVLSPTAYQFEKSHLLKTFSTRFALKGIYNGSQLTITLAKHNVTTTTLLVEILF